MPGQATSPSPHPPQPRTQPVVAPAALHDPPRAASAVVPGAVVPPPDRVAGASAVAAAVVFTGAFALLGVTFDYPAVLDEDAGTILTRFAEAGTPTRLLWYAMFVASLAFVPVAVLLARSVAARVPGAPSLAAVTVTVGVLAGLVQALGFARWTFVVPYLAETWTDPATTATGREAVVVALEVVHRFLGGAVGEHLGFGLTAAWAVGTALLLRRSADIPTLLPPVGLLAGAAVGTGVLEATGATWPGLIVAGGYALFAVWLAWLGLVLLLRPLRPSFVGATAQGG